MADFGSSHIIRGFVATINHFVVEVFSSGKKKTDNDAQTIQKSKGKNTV